MTIEKASKKKQKLKLLIEGHSGSGKTYSALRVAKGLVGEDAKIVVLDTENGSASLYADKFDFYTTELRPPFSPNNYIIKIEEVEKFKADVLIIDSMSMIWSGEGGCLDIQTGLGGRFQDWAKVTPQYESFMNKILQSNMHIICTARTKSDWAMDTNEKGKLTPQKVGLKTEARDGTDYTFTTVFRLNQNHFASCSKDRTGLFDKINNILTEDTGKILLNWLNNTKVVEIVEDDEVPFNEPKEELKSITPEEIVETSDNDIKALFKKKCFDAGLTQQDLKFFSKRHNIKPNDVNSIIGFLKDNDLNKLVAEYKKGE